MPRTSGTLIINSDLFPYNRLSFCSVSYPFHFFNFVTKKQNGDGMWTRIAVFSCISQKTVGVLTLSQGSKWNQKKGWRYTENNFPCCMALEKNDLVTILQHIFLLSLSYLGPSPAKSSPLHSPQPNGIWSQKLIISIFLMAPALFQFIILNYTFLSCPNNHLVYLARGHIDLSNRRFRKKNNSFFCTTECFMSQLNIFWVFAIWEVSGPKQKLLPQTCPQNIILKKKEKRPAHTNHKFQGYSSL